MHKPAYGAGEEEPEPNVDARALVKRNQRGHECDAQKRAHQQVERAGFQCVATGVSPPSKKTQAKHQGAGAGAEAEPSGCEEENDRRGQATNGQSNFVSGGPVLAASQRRE